MTLQTIKYKIVGFIKKNRRENTEALNKIVFELNRGQ